MPLTSQVKFDSLMTGVSVQYKPTQGQYLADRVLPPVPVQKESAAYWVYDKSRFDVPDSKRAPRSEYNRIDWNPSTAVYLTEEYGLEGEIDDRERENAAAPLDLDVDTTEIITDMVLNNRERRVADLVTSASMITQNTTLAGTSQWSDASNSDPLANAKLARTTIYAATGGYKPNKLLIGYDVYEALKLHPDILDVVKYTERAIITPQILAAVFDVEEVLIGGVQIRTSKEGQTDAFTDVWAGVALFFYSEARPSLKRASLGYQFRRQNLKAFRYREDKRNTDVIRVSEEQDETLVAGALGYLFLSVV